MKELDSYLSVEDMHILLEIMRIDAHNHRAVHAHMSKDNG